MKSIYEEFIERVENGESFNINVHLKNLKVGKEYLVKFGELQNRTYLNFNGNPLEEIEKLYYEYYISTPSEKSMKRDCYFYALPAEEMTDEMLVLGKDRELARAKLEGFILFCILEKKMQWEDKMGSWFWKSTKYPKLVLLKKWFVN